MRRDRYWLYGVFDCATDRPRLHIVRDPFGKLLLRSRTSVVVAADEIMRHSEAGEQVIMAQPTKPKAVAGDAQGPTDFDKLFALIEKWRAEPLGDEDAALAELERGLRDDPIRFHELDFSSWEEEDE